MWWHTVTHGRAKWRGNCRMQWVASTLHTTSEHGVSSITTADGAHLGCLQSTELTPRPPGWFKWTHPFRAKDEIWFLRVCHHISTALAHCFTGLLVSDISKDFIAFFFKCNESIHRLEYHWRWWYSPFKYQKRLTQQLHISQKTQILHLKFVQHWLWMLLFYAISHHVVCYDVYLHFREHCYLRLVCLPGKWR